MKGLGDPDGTARSRSTIQVVGIEEDLTRPVVRVKHLGILELGGVWPAKVGS